MPLLEIVRTDRTSKQVRAGQHALPGALWMMCMPHPLPLPLWVRITWETSRQQRRVPAPFQVLSLFLTLCSLLLLVLPSPSPAGHPGHTGVWQPHPQDASRGGQLHRLCRQPRVLPVHPGKHAGVQRHTWCPVACPSPQPGPRMHCLRCPRIPLRFMPGPAAQCCWD